MHRCHGRSREGFRDGSAVAPVGQLRGQTPVLTIATWQGMGSSLVAALQHIGPIVQNLNRFCSMEVKVLMNFGQGRMSLSVLTDILLALKYVGNTSLCSQYWFTVCVDDPRWIPHFHDGLNHTMSQITFSLTFDRHC